MAVNTKKIKAVVVDVCRLFVDTFVSKNKDAKGAGLPTMPVFEPLEPRVYLGAHPFAGGDGNTAGTAYQISTFDQFMAIDDENGIYLDKYFELTTDLDARVWQEANGQKDTMICFEDQGGVEYGRFSGTLDGQGYSIYGVKILETSSRDAVGLIGVNAGKILNLKLLDSDPSGISKEDVVMTSSVGKYGVGALAGVNLSTGTIEYCSANLEVRYAGDVGGLVGANFGTITKSFVNTEFVAASDGGAGSSGGLVGANYSGFIANCYVKTENNGYIYGSQAYTGGIVGTNNYAVEVSIDGVLNNSEGGQILNCYADVQLRSNNAANTGGIAGFNMGLIQKCFSTGEVYSFMNFGGVVGRNASGGVVEGSYSTMEWLSKYDGHWTKDSIAGGVVGYNNGGAVVRDCVYSSPGYGITKATIDDGAQTGTDSNNTLNNSLQEGYVTALGWNSGFWNNLSSGSMPTLVDPADLVVSAPAIVLAGTIPAVEGGSLISVGSAIEVDDNGSGNDLEVTITIGYDVRGYAGSGQFTNITNSEYVKVDGEYDHGKIRFKGNKASVNSMIDALTWTSPVEIAGVLTLSVQVRDCDDYFSTSSFRQMDLGVVLESDDNISDAQRAPVMNLRKAHTLNPIHVNDTIDSLGAGAGTYVSNMVAFETITAADGVAYVEDSIAVFRVDNSAGKWYYSRDDGSTWKAFTHLTGASIALGEDAVLLSASDKIAFEPDSTSSAWVGDNCKSYIKFRAWNPAKQSGSYSYVDISMGATNTVGGTTAFSASYAEASIAVSTDVVIPKVSLSRGSANPSENGTVGRFTVAVDSPVDSDLTVNYSVSGSARNGSDYNALSGTVVIAAGQSEAYIDIIPIDDSYEEGYQTVTIKLKESNSYELGYHYNRMSIVDNDGSQSVSVPVASDETEIRLSYIQDASENGTHGMFKIERTGSITSDLTVNYSTSGSASKISDYQDMSGTIVIPAGKKFVVLEVIPVDDNISEGFQSVRVTIESGDYTIVHGYNSLNIIDNDGYTVKNGVEVLCDRNATEGSTTGRFKIVRSGSTAQSLTVSYSLSGSAENGVDYASLSGTVTIAQGESFAYVEIDPTSDNIANGSKSVAMTIDAGNYDLSDNYAKIDIYDDDVKTSGGTADWAEVNGRNDNSITAVDFGVIEGYRIFRNLSFDIAGDADFFKFTTSSRGRQGDYIKVGLHDDNLDADSDLIIGLYDSNSELVDSHNSSEGMVKVSLKGLEAGDYYFGIVDYDDNLYKYNVEINAPEQILYSNPVISGIKVGQTWADATDYSSRVYVSDGVEKGIEDTYLSYFVSLADGSNAEKVTLEFGGKSYDMQDNNNDGIYDCIINMSDLGVADSDIKVSVMGAGGTLGYTEQTYSNVPEVIMLPDWIEDSSSYTVDFNANTGYHFSVKESLLDVEQVNREYASSGNLYDGFGFYTDDSWVFDVAGIELLDLSGLYTGYDIYSTLEFDLNFDTIDTDNSGNCVFGFGMQEWALGNEIFSKSWSFDPSFSGSDSLNLGGVEIDYGGSLNANIDFIGDDLEFDLANVTANASFNCYADVDYQKDFAIIEHVMMPVPYVPGANFFLDLDGSVALGAVNDGNTFDLTGEIDFDNITNWGSLTDVISISSMSFAPEVSVGLAATAGVETLGGLLSGSANVSGTLNQGITLDYDGSDWSVNSPGSFDMGLGLDLSYAWGLGSFGQVNYDWELADWNLSGGDSGDQQVNAEIPVTSPIVGNPVKVGPAYTSYEIELQNADFNNISIYKMTSDITSESVSFSSSITNVSQGTGSIMFEYAETDKVVVMITDLQGNQFVEYFNEQNSSVMCVQNSQSAAAASAIEAIPGNYTYSENSPFLTDLSGAFYDADNDTLSYSVRLVNGGIMPDWMKFDDVNCILYGTAEDIGFYELEVNATDGKSGYAKQVFYIDVTEVAANASASASLSDIKNETDGVTLAASVTGAYIFNNNEVGAGGDISAAIDTSKTALTTSDGNATTRNVLKDCRCLDGFAVDLTGVSADEVSLSDFSFMVGTANTNNNAVEWSVLTSSQIPELKVLNTAQGVRAIFTWDVGFTSNWVSVTVNESLISEPEEYIVGVLSGDADNDWEITFFDALSVWGESGSAEQDTLTRFDYDKDGEISFFDALYLWGNSGDTLNLSSTLFQDNSSTAMKNSELFIPELDNNYPADLEQVVYIDLDGESNLVFNGIDTCLYGIDVNPFNVDTWSVIEKDVVLQKILGNLNESEIAGHGVGFTYNKPVSGDYSTLYLGGDNNAFDVYGELYGIAESVDFGNADKNDKAFVFSDELDLGNFDSLEYSAELLADLIEHEVGHLVGLSHI